MNRDDVAIVGNVGNTLCVMCLMRKDIYDPRLYVYCSTDTAGSTASIGYIGSSVNGDIGVYRPRYVRPKLVSSDQCNSLEVTIEVFMDTLGTISMGYMDSNGDVYNVNPISITLTTDDPCASTSIDIMSSVRYSIDGFTLPGTECVQINNGLCVQDISAVNLNAYPFYIMFIPLKYYKQDDCLILDNLIGFSPASIVYTQCAIFPNSIFGRSTLCNNSIKGFSNLNYCGSSLFSYGNPGSTCGNDVTYTNLLMQEVNTIGSGLCASPSYCTGTDNLSCNVPDNNQPLNDNSSSRIVLVIIVVLVALSVLGLGGWYVIKKL